MNTENDYDPLINLALIHSEFESIHPFDDGNRRTGRVINILYLVLKNKIQSPILYLSKYIIKNKSENYELLKDCNEDVKSIRKRELSCIRTYWKRSRIQEHSIVKHFDHLF